MKESTFFHRYKEIILGLLMLALAGFYLHHATLIRIRSTVNVSVSAKLIPEILGVLVIILGVSQLVTGIKYLLEVKRQDRESGTPFSFISRLELRDAVPVILTFIIILGYVLVFEQLGFVVSSTLCMFCQMLILTPKGKMRPVLFFVISLVSAFVIYVAFRKGLSLSLPAGLLEGLPI